MTRATPRACLAALVFAGATLAAETEPQCSGGPGSPEVMIKGCTRLIEFAALERSQLAQAYFTRGTHWGTLANHDRAIADFTMAIELDPKLAGAHFNRALAYSEKDDHAAAVADYDAALRLSPREARAYIGRAVEWTLLGEYARAAADYEQAMRLQPESFNAYFGRGRARFYAGDFLGAASDFLRAHRLDASIDTALWIFLARKHADIPGEQTLAQEAGTSGEGEWPSAVVGLYLGRFAPDAVLNAASHADARTQRERRCEALFHIAQWQMLRGARAAASEGFRETQGACPKSYVEYEGAVAALRALQKP
ncbi:MAG TPA: tetratricopeptide repeat protein [Burkholderiales bacterium]|nr:tetratricopeptide repeat protein [Burkholderiales bacterium]